MNAEKFDSNASSSSDTINKAAQVGHEAVDKVAAAASSTQERAAKTYTSLEQSLRECTEDYPIRSLLWAVGIGFILGRLIR